MFIGNDSKLLFVLACAFLLTGAAAWSAQGDLPAASAASADNYAQRTKEFVVMGYEGLLFELRSGEGPYLRTLKELLGTKPDQSAHLIEQVRSLSKTYPNIMDFAEQVTKLRTEPVSDVLPEEGPLAPPKGPGIYSGDQLENALNHLTRGMEITVYVKSGQQFHGQFEEYAVKRLWMQGASKKSFLLDDILAIKAPRL